jgi:hypothetical protein
MITCDAKVSRHECIVKGVRSLRSSPARRTATSSPLFRKLSWPSGVPASDANRGPSAARRPSESRLAVDHEKPFALRRQHDRPYCVGVFGTRPLTR